jgi:hypothetical protein
MRRSSCVGVSPVDEAQQRKLELFGDGPWVDEPDRVEWRSHGLPCLIVRNKSNGALCGYVAVPPGHALYGLRDLPLDVHGGITYADACNEHICHVPREGEPAHVWWFGFDCAHAEDLVPLFFFRVVAPDGPPASYPGEVAYRDISYARNECEHLAGMLAWLG